MELSYKRGGLHRGGQSGRNTTANVGNLKHNICPTKDHMIMNMFVDNIQKWLWVVYNSQIFSTYLYDCENYKLLKIGH